MDKTKQDIAYFISFCIEQYKEAKGLSGSEAMSLLSEYGVLEYLAEHWEILHTQGRQWIIEDIDEFIKARDKYYQIVSKKDDRAFPSQPLGNFEVTQENVHLLIPSKLSWMANMLAEDKGISIVEAMKMLYSSEVYARLEKESTKAWHLGPVALYEEFGSVAKVCV